MSSNPTIDRAWIGGQFTKMIDSERWLANDTKGRAEDPPDPSLSVLYHGIAAADERHVTVVETIATRYGHTPSRSVGGGVGETLGRLKDKVVEMGTNPLDRLASDLAAKASAIHWQTAWVHAFEAIGDSASSRELAVILAEEQSHREALQQAFNRMVEQYSAPGDAVKQ